MPANDPTAPPTLQEEHVKLPTVPEYLPAGQSVHVPGAAANRPVAQGWHVAQKHAFTFAVLHAPTFVPALLYFNTRSSVR